MQMAAAVIVGYLMGCINFAYLMGKAKGNIDIRNHGSGNSGTTNAIRVMGWKFGVITFLGDFFKSLLAYILFAVLSGDLTLALLAGFFAVAGHNWPVFMGFKGGKGIASTLGLIMAVDIRAGLMALAAMALIIYFTKYVSLGSIVMAIMIPVLFAFFERDNWMFPIVGIILMIIAIFRHRANIGRLLQGTEHKLGSKKNGNIQEGV